MAVASAGTEMLGIAIAIGCCCCLLAFLVGRALLRRLRSASSRLQRRRQIAHERYLVERQLDAITQAAVAEMVACVARDRAARQQRA